MSSVNVAVADADVIVSVDTPTILVETVGPPGPQGPPGEPGPTTTKVEHPNTHDVAAYTWDQPTGRWQLVHYDTGWRDISGSLANGCTGTALLRRVGARVQIFVADLTAPAGGLPYATPFYVPPTGFRVRGGAGACRNQSTGAVILASGDVWTGIYLLAALAGTQVAYLDLAATTDDPIPVGLPGTMVSPAPSHATPLT